MPVTSFLRGAQGWTPVDHKVDRPPGGPRVVPVGPIHAVEPTAGTAACTGEAVVADPHGASFTPWAAGTCARCSEQVAPRAAPTPPEGA